MPSVGFDLDMTLVDSMKSIRETLLEVLRYYKVDIDTHVLDKSVGLPVKDSLVDWVGSKHIDAYELYKNIYQKSGYMHSKALPGAKEILTQLISNGYEVIIITAKNKKSAEIQLHYLNLPYTKIYGEVFGKGKTEALKYEKCLVYVGDHIEDFKSAQQAGTKFIGVTSNPSQTLLQDSNGNFAIIKNLSELFSHFSIAIEK